MRGTNRWKKRQMDGNPWERCQANKLVRDREHCRRNLAGSEQDRWGKGDHQKENLTNIWCVDRSIEFFFVFTNGTLFHYCRFVKRPCIPCFLCNHSFTTADKGRGLKLSCISIETWQQFIHFVELILFIIHFFLPWCFVSPKLVVENETMWCSVGGVYVLPSP